MHGYQLLTILAPVSLIHLLNYKDWYGVVRSPRPLIMIRFIRSLIKFRLPRNRIQQILKYTVLFISIIDSYFVDDRVNKFKMLQYSFYSLWHYMRYWVYNFLVEWTIIVYSIIPILSKFKHFYRYYHIYFQ